MLVSVPAGVSLGITVEAGRYDFLSFVSILDGCFRSRWMFSYYQIVGAFGKWEVWFRSEGRRFYLVVSNDSIAWGNSSGRRSHLRE